MVSEFINKFKLNQSKAFFAGIVGNAIDHYDSALYAFLAPFMAHVFFPNNSIVKGLLAVYSIKLIANITRPLGGIFFSYLSLKLPAKQIMSITLVGVALCTLMIGFIPTYDQIGILAPIFLTTMLGLQGFFAAGEHNVAALFTLEQIDDSTKLGKASTYYLASTMFGSLFASFAATIVANSSNPEYYWRYAFWIGLIAAITGIYLRINMQMKTFQHKKVKNSIDNTISIINDNGTRLFKIVFLNSFSFATYILPIIFFNNFIPLISDINSKNLLQHNIYLTLIDIALLPVAAFIITKLNPLRWMLLMASLFTITILPIFYYLNIMNILMINIVKLWIITLGVGFVVPLNIYIFKNLKGEGKYLISGLGQAIGTQIIGRNITIISLLLWQLFNNLLLTASYVFLISLITCIIIFGELSQNIQKKAQ